MRGWEGEGVGLMSGLARMRVAGVIVVQLENEGEMDTKMRDVSEN